jgi:hypothetical protein
MVFLAVYPSFLAALLELARCERRRGFLFVSLVSTSATLQERAFQLGGTAADSSRC